MPNDNIGNITQSVPKSINSLTYDPFVNRTKTITMSSGNNMNFSYDGSERRVYKKDVVSSVTTEILYLHDGMNAIVERNKTGTPTEYIYGPTGIIAIKTPASMHYVIKDHLGSTRVLVNTTDQPYAITTYDYSAFGTILTTPTSSAYLYTGQEFDKTSGLHNYKARMYDSDLMRFYGVDPAGQFHTPFSYSGNSPLNYVDPNGERAFLAVVAIYAAVHVSADAVRGDIDSWRDLGISTAEGVAGGTLAAASMGTAGLAAGNVMSVTSAAVSSELPAANIPLGRGASLSISPSFAFDGAGGVSFGGNVSASQRVGNAVIGTGFGTSYGSGGSAKGWNGWHANTRVFGGYAGKDFSFIGFTGSTSRLNNSTDPTYTQSHLGFRAGYKGAYFSYTNDHMAPGGTDKGRTAAAELGYKQFHAGMQIYTNDAGDDRLDNLTTINGDRYYKNGQAYYSPIYAGVNINGTAYRVGGENQWVQETFQNRLIHGGLAKLFTGGRGIPYFQPRPGSRDWNWYSSIGTYNQYGF